MKRLFFICLSLVLILFTLTECQKKDDALPQNQPADTTGTGNNDGTAYNNGDTTINLQNGRLTIAIPAGAMKEGTKVSIGSSNAAFVDTAHQLHQFELKPAGTTFKKPVTLTFHYDSAWLKGNSPWNIGIAYKDDKDGKWYPAVNGNVNTVNHTISIKTTHFSHWTIYNCFHLYMKADGQFSEDFSRTIVMKPRGDIGQLAVTMSEPPLWKQDPDKDKMFNHQNALVVPLIPIPIWPKEKDYKFIAPDVWFVNGIRNGNNRVGTIGLVPAPHTKNLFEYATPQKVPGDGDMAISAQINTLNHGAIILIQGVQIVSQGYMPSPDIISELYEISNGGTINSEVSSVFEDNTTTASVITHTSVGGITVTSSAIDTYNGIKTTIKTTPDDSQMRANYNRIRKGIDMNPDITDVDTSFTVGPYHFVIPDGLAAGDDISTSGSVRMLIDYIINLPDAVGHKHSVLTSYNKNAVVSGYDSVKTNAGTFYCLKVKYDYIVTDTLIVTGPTGVDVEKSTVFPTTQWLARGIGLVKSKSYDPSEGITTTITLDEIKRE